jgi:hypothetical protein
VLVGIGAFGFAVGPYASYIVSVTALKSPTIGFACRQATLQITVDAGVGYAIPKPIVTITNFFLHALSLKEISTVNNVLKMRPPWTVVNKRDEIRDGCSSAAHK